MRVKAITEQTIWDCRWSRLERPRHGIRDTEQPQTQWVCIRRPHGRRPVTDEKCETCEFWELAD